MRIRLLVPALIASVGLAAAPTMAAERSPLEVPDAVKTIRVHLDGAVQLAQLETQGYDFSGNLVRQPYMQGRAWRVARF